MAPPDPPSPMVNSGMPYCSTKCSRVIRAASADTIGLQIVWKVSSVLVAMA
jgi:hypothetical protein